MHSACFMILIVESLVDMVPSATSPTSSLIFLPVRCIEFQQIGTRAIRDNVQLSLCDQLTTTANIWLMQCLYFGWNEMYWEATLNLLAWTGAFWILIFLHEGSSRTWAYFSKGFLKLLLFQMVSHVWINKEVSKCNHFGFFKRYCSAWWEECVDYLYYKRVKRNQAQKRFNMAFFHSITQKLIISLRGWPPCPALQMEQQNGLLQLNGSINHYYLCYRKHDPTTDIATSNATACL